jgi:hypothetical protein
MRIFNVFLIVSFPQRGVQLWSLSHELSYEAALVLQLLLCLSMYFGVNLLGVTSERRKMEGC